MSVTTPRAGKPEDPRADDALEALLPPRRRTGAVVPAVAVLVLVLAWFSPQLLRPSVWDGSGGGRSTTFGPAGSQLLTTTVTSTDSWLPFTVERVGDVPGARVVGAWLVTGPDAVTAERGVEGSLVSADGYVAQVVSSPSGAQLPRRMAAGGPAALLVLWEVEDCDALQPEVEAVVTLRNVLGVTVVDTLPSFSAPSSDLVTAEAGAEDGAVVCDGR